MKQKLKSGYEWDWLSNWRKYYNWNAGVGKYINKRFRKQGKLEVRE